MPRRDPFDYGLDGSGSPALPRFQEGAFAKHLAFITREEDHEPLPTLTSFEHWSMYDYFRAVFSLAGGTWNEARGACHLLGIREMDSSYRRLDRVQGQWNDLIVVVREGDTPEIYAFEATIDPGGKLGKNPQREGQLVLAPGVHRARFGKGKHGGKSGDVMILTMLTFYRDADRDGETETENDERLRRSGAEQGVHIHWSNRHQREVGTWSTGCTVLHYGRDDAEYEEFVGLMRAHAKDFGNVKGVAELDQKSQFAEVAREAALDSATYDIEYVVTSTAAFRTPAEVLAQHDFYFLLEQAKRPPESI